MYSFNFFLTKKQKTKHKTKQKKKTLTNIYNINNNKK